jgi:hypothetical protein
MTDEFLIDDYTVVDRSTIERFSLCPAQARFIELGRVRCDSDETESGSAVHNAFSEVTSAYVESRGQMGVNDLRDELLQLACASRPDIQPDVIAAVRSVAHGWAKFLNGIHHDNVLRWDGGEGERSGQLAHDWPEFRIRATTELDLLYVSESPEVAEIVDYKSGYLRWDHSKVAESFQFAFQSWVTLHNYPDVQAVRVRIWNTRFNQLTYPVLYKRSELYELDWRVRSACQAYASHRDIAPEQSATWPTVQKCSMCNAAALCPAASRDIHDGALDACGLVDEIVAREANLKALQKIASGIVKSTGRDIETPAGNYFGTGRPKRKQAPKMESYSLKKDDDDGESSDGSAG